jgi:hypothetical protein
LGGEGMMVAMWSKRVPGMWRTCGGLSITWV